MKEQDAAHSFDDYNKNDANLCPVMNGYYCFDRACGIDHKKQCMMINPKDKIYVDGSKAGDYIQQHIAYRREMEMNYAKMQDELTRLRSEIQQAKHDNECLKDLLLKEQIKHSDKDYTVIKNDELDRLTSKLNQLMSELQQERELRKELIEAVEKLLRVDSFRGGFPYTTKVFESVIQKSKAK